MEGIKHQPGLCTFVGADIFSYGTLGISNLTMGRELHLVSSIYINSFRVS